MSSRTSEQRRSCGEVIRESLTAARDKAFHENRWGKRHVLAWTLPNIRTNEDAIKSMIVSLAQYADVYAIQYDSEIGDDGVLGVNWLDTLKGVRGLLNGECGRFDCGTLDALLLDMAAVVGFDTSEL